MARNSRAMSNQSIQTVVDIISRFRSKPKWSVISAKAKARGVTHSLRAIQGRPEIKEAYQKKKEEQAGKRGAAKASRAKQHLPATKSGMQAEILQLREKLATSQKKVTVLTEVIERLTSEADDKGIPLLSISRPVQPRASRFS